MRRGAHRRPCATENGSVAMDRLVSWGEVVSLGEAGTRRRPTAVLVPLAGSHAGRAIDADEARAGASGFGFEGGRIFALDGVFHLFTSEIVSEPIWVQTEFAHWVSSDGLTWHRQSTVLRSSGDFTGEDGLAAMFSPMAVFNEFDDYWDLFFVAYRSAPDMGTEFLRNHKGRILRARSVERGQAGIYGPWKTEAVVMEPGVDSQDWEGLQGTDSFFPYQVGDSWLALYGSATTEWFSNGSTDPARTTRWMVGLAESKDLTGPWRRLPHGNPLQVEPRFMENPVVARLSDGSFFALYDNGHIDPALCRTFGLMTSEDGMTWTRQDPIRVPDLVAPWATTVRTPLGVVLDDAGRLLVYFTAFESPAGAPSDFGGRGHVGVAVINFLHKK